MNCPHNQTYRFPLSVPSPSESSGSDYNPSTQIEMFDLHSQAPIVKASLSTKTLSLESKRRVKSL